MTSVEERVVRELKVELDQVPHGSPAPIPKAPSRWPRYLAVAAALVVVVVGGWMVGRISSQPGPVAAGVSITEVAGDADPEVADLWQAWWEAWAEVRATATEEVEGEAEVRFRPGPLEELAVDRITAMSGIDDMWKPDINGSLIGVGEDTVIRLAPTIHVEEGRATVRDCVFLDPIPWPALMQPGSTAGTVLYTAEMEFTPSGWKIAQFGPERIGAQLAADQACVPGQT